MHGCRLDGGWTWRAMTHRKTMQHGSISKGDFFVIYSMTGFMEKSGRWVSLDRSNSIVFFVNERGAVYQMVSTGRRRLQCK
jgi:hypothetical protein